MSVGFGGSSNTFDPTGYSDLISDSLVLNHPLYIFSFTNMAKSGWATFPNLVNKADLSAANVIVMDQSNDGSDDLHEFEAYVCKASAAGQRLVIILNPAWTDADLNDGQINTPSNLVALQGQRAILSAYGVSYVDMHALIQAHVSGGGHIADWFADTAHYTATGDGIVSTNVLAILPTGGRIPTPLPSYVNAAAADYVGSPVIKTGTQRDSVTGSWTTNGTSITSSSVGATVTFSGTFRKFGIYNSSATYPTCTVSIDGGAPATMTIYPNGYDIGTRGAHTIVMTVTTSLTIDEFWAI